jgi:hypothetical protein
MNIVAESRKTEICNDNMLVLSKLIGCWFGASLAIDVEAVVKFKAKSLDRRVGLDVGRTVFAAFHKLETLIVLATIATRFITSDLSSSSSSSSSISDTALMCASGAFLVQLLVIAPALNRRVAAEVDEGKPLPKSNVHLFYLAFEAIKLGALVFV